MEEAGLAADLTALLERLAARSLSAADASALVRDLVARHREPHRRYHTLEHVRETLAIAEELGGDDVVALTVWFHDAVYDPRLSDNEERSARYASDVLRGFADDDVVDEVARLVRLTVSHEAPRGDLRAAVLVDADLSILGADPARYERYRQDVRIEYAHLDDDMWTRGRTAVLEELVGRVPLFSTDDGVRRFDAPARVNLRAELIALSSS